MAQVKHLNHALFDKDWKYLGGRVLPEGEKPDLKEEKAAHAVEVDRFPQHYETWDPKSKSWVADHKQKAKVLKDVQVQEAIRKEELAIPDVCIQHWMYLLLERLGVEMSEEVIKEFFPMLDPEKLPTSLSRKES